jgi:hypothetical protein
VHTLAFGEVDICSMIGDNQSFAIEKILSEGEFARDCFVQCRKLPSRKCGVSAVPV